MSEIIAIHFNDERLAVDDTVFCELEGGRMLATSGSAAVAYSTVLDADPTVAFQRMLDQVPTAFREVKRKAAVEAETAIASFTPSAAGFTANLTEGDRNRLRLIVRKHHRFYFASEPTDAQVDQLIDSLGVEVASKLVKSAVDGGQL